MIQKTTKMRTKIDPFSITNYNRSEEELQLFLLFCIVVAGKTAYIQSQKLSNFLLSIQERLMLPEHISPFESLNSAYIHGILLEEIHKAKLGQYKKIYNSFIYICENPIDLKKCTPEILQNIPGVGMKSSRFFLLHSDKNWQNKIAILDVHILRFMRENICNLAPKTTPANPKTYYYWESMFLDYCLEKSLVVAEFDLEVWSKGARKAKTIEIF